MDVVSNCPLLVGGRIWSTARGAVTLTIACKATYVICPGVSQLAEDQEPINEDDNYWDDDSARSLYAPSDLAPYKPAADVVLVGYAFAPGRIPVQSFHVRMIVGDIDKSIEISGDRSWSPEGALTEASRVVRVPLRYERAGGGPGTWNPVGIRPDTQDLYGRLLVPNLMIPGKFPTQRGEVIEPIGYGPIGPMWSLRTEKLGAYAGTWDYHRWADRPLPEGFDPAFFNVAPRDQRVGEIRGNERIVLENLHPEHPRLVTSLPGLRPRAIAERASGRRDEVQLVGDSMWIDTERGLCTVVWRGLVGLTHAQEAGKITVSLDDGARQSAVSDPPTSAPPPSADRRKPVRTLDLTDPTMMARLQEVERQTMPFGKQGSSEITQPPTPTARASVSGGLPFASTPAPPAPPSPVAPPPLPTVARPPMMRPPEPSVPAMAPPQPPPPPQWAPVAAPPPPEPAAKLSIGQRAVAESAAPAPPPALRDLPTASKSVATPSAPAPTQMGRLGAAAASDAAAVAAVQTPQASVETTSAAPIARPRNEYRSPTEPFVDLLWFDKTAPKRIRAQASFAAELRDGTSTGAWLTMEDTQQPKQEIKDRRDVVRVLRRVPAVDADGVTRALMASIDEDGALSPSLVVVAGEVMLFFHEVQTLKATIAVASPMAGVDKRLKETLDAANDLVQSDWKCTALAAEGMTSRLKEAFGQANRTLPPNFLDQNVERVLLEQRSYQKRMILGEKRIRAHLVPEGSSTAIPCYLLEEVEAKLPLFTRFRVSVIAEVRGQQDQYETNPLALVGLALARVQVLGTGSAR